MSFASSIWLWAIAGIIIPVLIHLWNVRRGKTLKIGSISFFAETPVSRARSLRLTDILQLLVRCLLFIVLACFVAGPFLSTRISSTDKGWLLMEKTMIGAAYQQYGKDIDSLLDSGVELHELGGTFELMKPGDSTDLGNDSVGYWDALRRLQDKAPAGLPLTIYTDNKLARFSGARPDLNMNLTWKLIGTNEEFSWIDDAYTSYDDSIVVVAGTSGPLQTSFNTVVLSKSDPMINLDQMTVRYGGQTHPIDTSTLKVRIFAEPGTDDGRYLAAAIVAVKEFIKHKVSISYEGEGQKETDWLFWLSTQKIPENVTAKHIFKYAGGDEQSLNTRFELGPAMIPVFRIFVDSSQELSAKNWRTTSGKAIMRYDPGTSAYKFYSRFDPNWNELVWSEQFPQHIIELLFPKLASKGRDLRMIDERQATPLVNNKASSKAGILHKDISKWFWLLALGLFLVERLISFRKQKLADG